MRSKSPADVAASLPLDIADAMRNGKVTFKQARVAESFGLLDVWDLPGNRYCPCMTEFGLEVCRSLEKQEPSYALEDGR